MVWDNPPFHWRHWNLHTVSSETHVSLSTSSFTTVSDGNEEIFMFMHQLSSFQNGSQNWWGSSDIIVCLWVGFVWRFGDYDANQYSLIHWTALK